MKRSFFIAAFTIGVMATLAAFKKAESSACSENCGEWRGQGIQFRQCETDWGLRTHQFFNGYSVKVWIYFHLNYTDGCQADGNVILDPSETSSASSDCTSGTNKVVDTWQITKKEKQDHTGTWVTF